jgi:transketolase
LQQFINVVFGNTSLKKGVAVENVILSQRLSKNTSMFPGPQFGIQGLRDLLGVPQAPLICTALKPMGKSSRELADMAYHLARGGIDIIKDDHGLADQVWAPFDERVRLCAKAVQKANGETGKRCIYAACLNAPAGKLIDRAYYAQKVGAGAIMVLPGISGFDILRELASRQDFRLPILVHPAMLGGWLHGSQTSHPRGLSHEFLFGILPRLCGGDAVIFPNAGGRFQFSHEECQAVAEGCRRPMGRFEPILPSPAGGMKLNRVSEMRQVFGDDTLFLIGGALLEQGPDLEADAQLFFHCVGRDRTYTPPNLPTVETKSSEAIPQPQEGWKRPAEDSSSLNDVQRVASNVRRRVLEYTIRNNGGYLSQACSSAETLATLYLRALKLGPSVAPMIPGPFRGSPCQGIETICGEGYNGDPSDPALDRLIFSPVHYALVLYALLVEVGRLDIAAFESFNKDGSTVELIGAEHSPGHAVTAGSLAQALSQGSGIAYGRKLKRHTGRVVVFMSDGEFQEGQTWEAVQALVYHKIDNLAAVVDVNKQQCDGNMDSVMDVGDLATKLKDFGAHVLEVDGHDITAIEKACGQSQCTDRPTFVLCNTDPCKGFPFLRDRAPKLHYIRFKSDAEKATWEEILRNMEEYSELDMKPPRKQLKVDTSDDGRGAPVLPPSCARPISDILEDSIECIDPELIEMSTRPHRTHLVSWMKAHPTAIVLTADLTSSCEADLLRDSLPNQ